MQMQGAQSNTTFTLQTYENRFIDFQSIDVEILGYGTVASQILQITHPVQMNGFLTVLMAEQNINVSSCFLQALIPTSKPLLDPTVAGRWWQSWWLLLCQATHLVPTLVVLLLQVQALPVNLSDAYAILPVLKHIQPPLPTVYVLGTVLQVGSLPDLRAAYQYS